MNKTRYCLWGCLAVVLLLWGQIQLLGHVHPLFLPCVIVVLGLYGAWCAYTANTEMSEHLRHFKSIEATAEEKKRFYPPAQGLDVVDYCDELTRWMDEQQSPKKADKPQNTPKPHFVERVGALVKTQNMAEKKKVDIDLPNVGDLGVLTEMKERSRSCVVGLNVTISFLLILGILGTLLGIHGSMAGEHDLHDLAALKPALLPSAFAVGITVLLMIGKGLYQHKRVHYMAALNRFTLLNLIPHLQRDGKNDELMGQVESGSEGFKDAVMYVGNFTQSVAAGTENLRRELVQAQDKLNRMRSIRQKLAQRVAADEKMMNQLTRFSLQLEASAAQIETELTELRNTKQRVVQLTNLYNNIFVELTGVMESLNADLRELVQRVGEKQGEMQSNCDIMAPVSDWMKSIMGTNASMGDAEQKTEALLKSVEQRRKKWRKMGEEIEKIQERAAAIQNGAEEITQESRGMVEGTSDFLNNVLPADLLQTLSGWPKDMKQNRQELKRYEEEIEQQVARPLFSLPERIFLGVITVSVIVKIFFV